MTAPRDLHGVLRPQPRPARPVRLTRRGEHALAALVLVILSLLIIAALNFPVYVVVGPR